MAVPAVSDQMTTALADPANVAVDGFSVGLRSIAEQIAGLRFAAAAAAQSQAMRGMMLSKLDHAPAFEGHFGFRGFDNFFGGYW